MFKYKAKLVDYLFTTAKKYEPPPPYIHKQESADELYDKVVANCIERAEGGCFSLTYRWDYVYSDVKSEWEEQHKVVLEIVDRLKEDGLTAICNKEFPEPIYDSYYDEWEFPTGYHNIIVGWSKLPI